MLLLVYCNKIWLKNLFAKSMLPPNFSLPQLTWLFLRSLYELLLLHTLDNIINFARKNFSHYLKSVHFQHHCHLQRLCCTVIFNRHNPEVIIKQVVYSIKECFTIVHKHLPVHVFLTAIVRSQDWWAVKNFLYFVHY